MHAKWPCCGNCAVIYGKPHTVSTRFREYGVHIHGEHEMLNRAMRKLSRSPDVDLSPGFCYQCRGIVILNLKDEFVRPVGFVPRDT